MFYPVEHDKHGSDPPTAIKTMKTRMLHLAATLFAVASLGPVALAGQSHPIQRQTPGPAKQADCCLTHEACKGVACCDSKMKTSPALGGRGSHSSLKKARTCTSSCTVAASDRKPVCRMGSKA